MLSDVDDGIAARRNDAREEKREEMLGRVAGAERKEVSPREKRLEEMVDG